MIAIDLSKKQALDADPKNNTANQFYWKPRLRMKQAMFFIIEETKETILDFSQGTVKVL